MSYQPIATHDNIQICDSNHCKKISEIIAFNINLKTLVLVLRKEIFMRKEFNELNIEALNLINLLNIYLFLLRTKKKKLNSLLK